MSRPPQECPTTRSSPSKSSEQQQQQLLFHTKPTSSSPTAATATSDQNELVSLGKNLIPPTPTDFLIFPGSSALEKAAKYLLHSSSQTEEVKRFIDIYCEEMINVINPKIEPTTHRREHDEGLSSLFDDSFSCPVCLGVFIEPLTIACGHSYCRKCLGKEVPGRSCRRCEHGITAGDIGRTKVNVVVSGLVEKWWPNYVRASQLRKEGNDLYDQAQGPDDHLSLGNRVQALLLLNRNEDALKDAEAAIEACAKLDKGYYRKSVSLSSLGKYEDAFTTLTMCLYLVKARKLNDDSSAITSIKTEFNKILKKLFQQSSSAVAATSNIRRHSVEQVQYSPYPKPISRKSREKQQENEEFEYNSSDEEGSKYPMDRSSRFKMPRLSIAGSSVSSSDSRTSQGSSTSSIMEYHRNRIRKLFERAVRETKLLQKELLDKQEQYFRENGYGEPKLQLRPVNPSLIAVTDFECSLCCRLFFQPVTTFCGHTYCRTCLERSLDHSTFCPLCKTSLQDHRLNLNPPITHFIETALAKFFPKEKEERLKQHLEDIEFKQSDPSCRQLEIPIFVCTIGFPTVPCPLHVFEPRYRLMIRRSMEARTKRFGMCCYLNEGDTNYAEYGTLLEIRNVQYFADGRSVIDTIGDRRFKVLERSVRDGYNTARIEILQDNPVLPADRPRLQATHDQVYQSANDWLKSISQMIRQRIHSHFGAMPRPEEDWMEKPDGPAWTWWLLAILPLDTKAQLAILKMNTLQKRLDSILKVLEYVKKNRM